MYPTIDKGSKDGVVGDEDITVGLTAVFPKNSIKQRIDFQVGQGTLELRDSEKVSDPE